MYDYDKIESECLPFEVNGVFLMIFKLKMVNKAKLNLVVFMIMNWVTFVDAQCTTSNNGLRFRCETHGADFDIELKLCGKTPKISISIDVDALDLHIKEDADTDLDIPVGPIGKVQLSLKSAGAEGDVIFSVKFNALGFLPIPLVSERTIGDPNCVAVLSWFQSQSIGVLIAIGVAALICFIAFICCCYCCCCRNRTQMAPPTIIMQSAPGSFVPSNSNLPYEKQEHKSY